MKKLAKPLSAAGYGVCCAAVLTFLALSLFGSDERATGFLMMCTRPTFLATLALCKSRNINLLSNPKRQGIKWLIAAPLAICGVYLAYVLISIILMATSLFAVTIIKFLSGGF
ncbi:MAG: hypothetical protein LBN43_07300 [Oscillospiraceae bacterium]|jgi:hypothetical protein|nr:hypothetical protein [Oscillospiraceae bacterium]